MNILNENNEIEAYYNAQSERVDEINGRFYFKVMARIEDEVIKDIKCEGQDLPFIKEMCKNLEELTMELRRKDAYNIKVSQFYKGPPEGKEYAEELLVTLCKALYSV